MVPRWRRVSNECRGARDAYATLSDSGMHRSKQGEKKKRGSDRDSKTSVICSSLMFNGCSWIKNFKLLSARWKRRGRERLKRRGQEERKKEEEGGFQAAYLHLYIINPRFSNQREEKKPNKQQTATEHTLESITYSSAAQTLEDDSPIFLARRI